MVSTYCKQQHMFHARVNPAVFAVKARKPVCYNPALTICSVNTTSVAPTFISCMPCKFPCFVVWGSHAVYLTAAEYTLGVFIPQVLQDISQPLCYQQLSALGFNEPCLMH